MKILIILIISIMELISAETKLFIEDNNGIIRELNKKATNNMSIYSSANVSRKAASIDIVKCIDTIIIKKDDKILNIKSTDFGPAPVEVFVYDNENKILFKESQDNDEFDFNINLKKINSAKLVKILNYFGDTQLCKKIIYK